MEYSKALKNTRPKENENAISYIIRIISRPNFTRIPVKQLENTLRKLNKDINLDAVISKANKYLTNCELIKTKILGDKKQYYVLRRIVKSIEKDTFIPNDNLVKQRKIEYQNPYVTLQLREYTKPVYVEKKLNAKQPLIGLHNAIVDKEKNLTKLNTENYDEILKKLKKGNLTYNVSKLSKNQRYTVLVKFYETSETSHSFTVFKQYYQNFLYEKKLQNSISNQRILEFLEKEIKNNM